MRENSLTREGAIFKLNFLSLIDKTIESILPIQYEFPLEKITTNLKEEEEYQQFIYNTFIPRLKEFMYENMSFYKIVAIELKIKNDQILNNNLDENDKNNDPEYLYKNQSIKIKLNEKGFQEVRDDILNMLFIDFINSSGERNYNYLNYIEDNDENVLDEEEYSLLNLKNFINYRKINIHNKIDDYEYKISFKFKEYLKIVLNKDLYTQFKFWFHFLLQKIKINIVSIEYEYYMNINELENDESEVDLTKKKNNDNNNMLKNKIINFYNEYENFVDDILNDKSPHSILKTVHKNKRPKITLILINNMRWVDDLLFRIEEEMHDTKRLFINYIQKEEQNKNLRINDIKEIQTNEIHTNSNNKINKNLYYNNIYIKLFGKYSIYQLNDILDKKNINSIENIIINIDNFNNFEYISLMQEEEKIINSIRLNAIKIFTSLNKYLIKIKKDKLKSIVFYIKYFNNSNILLTEIQDKFNEFMIDLIKQSAYVKYINIFFSNIISEDDYNTDSYIKSDLMYSLPYLDEYEYKNIKLSSTNKKRFKLVLFDNNIRIKKSQTIDFYYFEYFSLQRITKLVLGYIHNISELNLFLNKIKLYELCNMKNFICFLKSNNKINEKSLTTFFKLQWPKNTLTSIKIIFEKFAKIKEDSLMVYPRKNKNIVLVDMNKIFNNIIHEFYFKTMSKDEIEKIMLDKYQGDLGGTMIVDKKNNDSFEQKINIIKKKKTSNNENEENSTTNNNTNITNTKNRNTTNISMMQHSKNILLQTSQPTINFILDNNNRNYLMNDLKSVNDTFNNNNTLYNNSNLNNKNNYPLKSFLILNSETYLKYFLNSDTKELLKNTYLYNSIMEKYKRNNSTIEDKYNIIENCKKSLLVLNKNKNSIFSLLISLSKTKKKSYSRLLSSKLKYKIIHYEYYQRVPTIFDYVISFLNERILIYNDFKYSKKLFKNVLGE